MALNEANMCCSCLQETELDLCVVIQKEDVIKGTKAQSRCRKCHNLRGRVSTLIKTTGGLDEYKEFNNDERVDFMNKARDLCGNQLHKQLVESIQWVKTQRNTVQFSEHGDFEDEDVLKDRYETQPAVFDNIKANARSMKDPIRGVTMYLVPKFTVNISSEDTILKESKRRLESESTAKRSVQPQKKIKTEKPLEIGDGAGPADQAKSWAQMPQAVLPEGQLARIAKSLPKLEELQLGFTTTMVEAESPEVEDFMAPKLLEKARELRTFLDDVIVIYQGKLTSKSAAKGEMKAHFENARDRTDQIKTIELQIKGMLDLAGDAAKGTALSGS